MKRDIYNILRYSLVKSCVIFVFLVEGIEQFSYACMEKRYKEAAHLIDATDELLVYFKDYM